MPNIKLEQSVTETQTNKDKIKKMLPIAIGALVVALVFIVGGSIFFNRVQEKRAMEESYQSLVESLNVNFTDDSRLLIVEAAKEFTYSPTDYKSLEKVPDQLRSLFASFSGDSEIVVSDVDLTTVGEKQMTATITKKDRFGQVAQKQARVNFTVKDTQEPQVDVAGSYVVARNEEEVNSNILRIYDPVFGYYPYSSNLDNHTYKIDISKIDFNTPGQYQAKVVINDSGNIIERYFDVYVPKVDAMGNIIEDIVIEPEKKEEELLESTETEDGTVDEGTAEEVQPTENN